MNLLDEYKIVREHSNFLCSHLIKEDYSLQASEEVSPPKWHLAHTTWFFEQFILVQSLPNYVIKHPQFNFLFNSYYNAMGKRTVRNQRGLMSRPSVDEVMEYRSYVDEAISQLIIQGDPKTAELVVLGMNHEQQHQELLLADLKFSLWHNPLNPQVLSIQEYTPEKERQWISIEEGVYPIGFEGKGFCYDNEMGRHSVYIHPFSISSSLVTNGQYLEFIQSGAYRESRLWLDEGWSWVQQNQISSPLYWEENEGDWSYYTLDGMKKLDPKAAVSHVSFYEAQAYATWRGERLPTEFEWEVSQSQFEWGKRWEWTYSAYLPYPGFEVAPGALGEYNGKFMVNQMVLRGASVATPAGHSRPTYRNFFHPQFRWQFKGIRLAKSINL